MIKRELLKDLLEQAKKVELPIEVMKNLFIGMGNPDSKILIVGKEASIDVGIDGNVADAQSKLEIVDNISQWERDINKHWSEVEYRGWVESKEKYSPLYPYKGQIKKRDSGKNFGTSPTWLNYQKVRDAIWGFSSGNIDFHENCFITELNQIPSRYSKKQDEAIRKECVYKRLKTIFESEFIQSFPVIILACGVYIVEHRIDVGSVFGVEQNPQEKCVPGNPRQWYKMYRNLSGNPPKLVIHTRQLSLNITDALHGMIGKDISDFCAENNIEL